VYQPNAIVGNSRVLVGLGDKGELMSFFYPHIDFCQNLHEGMPAVFSAAAGGLVWTFEPSWQASQRYLGRTNVVETRLRHAETGLAITITDFVHPTEPALFRRFRAGNVGSGPLQAKLFQYLDPQLGEVEQRNAIHYHPDRGIAVAYWRNICFAVAGTAFGEYGCGRVGSPNSAKLQMETGELNRQMEEIGDIDLAIGWELSLAPGEQATHDLVIAAGGNEPEVVERATAYRDLGWEALLRWARSRWEEHLAASRKVRIEPDLEEAFYRSLLAIDLLVDPETGSVLAAPEFDPAFERSGGYGFCWPRDGVEVCLALDAAGYPEYMGRFLAWARHTQRKEGFWEQRYWLSGQRGPAWCTPEEGLQVDQTASVLFAMGRHARRLDEQGRVGYLEATWESARSAARYLVAQLDASTDLHRNAFDLWETFRGSFTYSNAAIASALREGAFLAELVGEEGLADEWREKAERIKSAVMSRLWLGEIFARGLDARGRLDPVADASVLGLIVPFELLCLDDPGEREMARTCVEGLVRRLGKRMGGGETLRRFDGDQYAGGGPGALTTLWLARACLRLSLAYGGEARTALAYRQRAVASMRAVLAAGTSAGLLPEMMGASPGGRWAVPHAWTTASFVLAALALDELSRTSPQTG
jgi:oligosaccharide amylase